MTIHLIKLCVGAESFSDLADWQTERLKTLKKSGKKPELMHITRNTPKRGEELLDGGSLYWVIKGWVCARQRILELRPLIHDGIHHCGLVLDKELVKVKPRPHRPFQGWRYLNARDAPADMQKGKGYDELPEEMRKELIRLGLI